MSVFLSVCLSLYNQRAVTSQSSMAPSKIAGLDGHGDLVYKASIEERSMSDRDRRAIAIDERSPSTSDRSKSDRT